MKEDSENSAGPTAFQIAMIAATLGKPNRQGVDEAWVLFNLARDKISPPVVDTEPRSISEAMKIAGIRTTDGLKNILSWKYQDEEKADKVFSDLESNGVKPVFIEYLISWRRAKKSEEGRKSRAPRPNKRRATKSV